MKTLKVVAFALTLLALSPFSVAAKTTVRKSVVPSKTQKHARLLSVSAIRGADEKDFANPTTRCLTPAIQTLHTQTVKQMEADITKYGNGHDAAVGTYGTKIGIIWSAMAEPYCGYGSQGTTAVRRSFIKSVATTRAEFLAATKK